MKHWNWIGAALCVAGLIGVRYLENVLFYDPFLKYFASTSSNPAFPQFEWTRLIGSHLFRFLLNLIFSLGIVHFLFLNKKWTFQAMVLITLSFVLFFPIYLYSVYTEFSFGNLFSFYIRRFVIQPLPILLIVPLFYYRKNLIKEIKAHFYKP